jgi:hypothetical protein
MLFYSPKMPSDPLILLHYNFRCVFFMWSSFKKTSNWADFIQSHFLHYICEYIYVARY